MHGREKQEVERYFLRLKILLRNISPYIYIYIYLCRSQSSRVCKTKNKRLKRGGQKWRDEEEKWKQSRRVFPPLFVYARETHVHVCVYFARQSVCTRSDSKRERINSNDWSQKRDGEYSLAWPILTAPYTCRPFVAIQEGTRARLLCPLLDPYLPTAFRNEKLLAA